MKKIIATIYNDVTDSNINIIWDSEDHEITYRDIDSGEEWSADETAETLEKAIDDTYCRYNNGWDLNIIG